MAAFRRLQTYDYAQGGSMFISFHLEPRVSALDDVMSDGRMRLSLAGELLAETIRIEREKRPRLVVRSWQIMPDHLHFRLTFPSGLREPLRQIGRFVQEIKRWSIAKMARVGLRLAWQENYHDRLCLSRAVNEHVDEYIRLNPLKWALMHGPDPPMKVIEPLDSPLLEAHEWWAGVGNAALLDGARPLLAVRLSRCLRPEDARQVLSGLLAECRRGLVPISTFISPLEVAFFNCLAREGLPMVAVVPDPLKTVHRPRVEQTPLFAQNRLLLLSHLQEDALSRCDAWHNLNSDIARIAQASGGKAIYVR